MLMYLSVCESVSVRVLVVHSVFPVDPKDMESLSSFFLSSTTVKQSGRMRNFSSTALSTPNSDVCAG